ncbi:MAG: hypothetical protein SVK08_00455 [Halobacteriota archaeon]|nr:hypothetical protein [Halobacteriota archaeon]
MYEIFEGDVITTTSVNERETMIRVGTAVTVAEYVEVDNIDTQIKVLLGDIPATIRFRDVWKLHRNGNIVYKSGHSQMWPPIIWDA